MGNLGKQALDLYGLLLAAIGAIIVIVMVGGMVFALAEVVMWML